MKRLRPARAIRAHCIECVGGSYVNVETCPSEKTCLLWPHRMGRGRVLLRVIRAYCLHCVGGVRKEAVNCTAGPKRPDSPAGAHECPLWFYRPGTRPYAGRGRDLKKNPIRPLIACGLKAEKGMEAD